MKTAVITGGKGQLGSFLSEKFLDEGFRVVNVNRRSAMPDYSNIEHLFSNPNFILHEGDVCDFASVSGIIKEFQPWIIMNTAAQSHVHTSYSQPIVTNEINYIGVINCLEAIRLLSPETRFWNACTSERFGDTKNTVQDENTPPSPVSPYAVSKVAAEYIIDMYKKTYKMHVSYGIMFNFESENRSKAFVTRKITDYIGKTFNIVENVADQLFATQPKGGFVSTLDAYTHALNTNQIERLELGNLEASRSWTYCGDTVEGIFKQINLDQPDNFIFGIEETHTIREFLTEAFKIVGIDDWTPFVVQNPKFMRPSEVPYLKPCCEKAKRLLDWEPKVTFKELVAIMVAADIERHDDARRSSK